MFVMELPAYKRPSLRIVIRRMTDAGWAFLRRAGTFILASMPDPRLGGVVLPEIGRRRYAVRRAGGGKRSGCREGGRR